MAMQEGKWLALGGLAYVLATGYGLVGRMGAEARTAEVPPSNVRGRSTLSTGIERVNWDSGSSFLEFHGSRGAGRQNSALADFLRRNDISTGSYGELESSFRSLAASLNPLQARADHAAAQRSGAAPEVVLHFQYLAELAEAFRDGRLPELLRKWFGDESGNLEAPAG